MPPIGKRIIKSALAAFLCFCIHLLRGGAGTPFYSAIAAILCTQPNVSNSKTAAINRIIGTIIGAFWGSLFLLTVSKMIPKTHPILSYALIAIGIIVVIYSTVLIKRTSSSYLSSVVFLSITVAHSADVSPFPFAFNRMLDTLIGIFVALFLSYLPFLFRKGQHILYVISLEHMQLHDPEPLLSKPELIRMNLLLERGANILIATRVSPCHFMPHLGNLELALPVICLNGSTSFDIHQSTYLGNTSISPMDTQEILEVFQRMGKNCFTNSLYHDFLHIYYNQLENPVEKAIYNCVLPRFHRHYIQKPVPTHLGALTITAVHEKKDIELLAEELRNLSCFQKIQYKTFMANGYPDYYYLEIYPKETSVLTVSEKIRQELDLQKIIQVPFTDAPTLIKTLEQSFYHKNFKKRLLDFLSRKEN